MVLSQKRPGFVFASMRLHISLTSNLSSYWNFPGITVSELSPFVKIGEETMPRSSLHWYVISYLWEIR